MGGPRKYSDEELLEELRFVARELKSKQVCRKDFDMLGQMDSGTLLYRFGTWNKAVTLAGLEPRPVGVRKRSLYMRKKLRPYKILPVLKRDKFKCCLCGKIPSKFPFRELHVDHIMPVSKGGTNDIDNLWTLCSKCNLSKRAKIIPWIMNKAEQHLMWCGVNEKAKAFFREEARKGNITS